MVEKLKNSIKNYFSNGPKAVFVTVLLIMISTVIITGTRKTLYVYIDGKENKITTFRSNLEKALTASDIEIGSKDKVTPGLGSNIKDKDKIYIKKAVNVELELDGKTLTIQSAEDDVETMLTAEGIQLNALDRVSPSKEEPLGEDLKVEITRVDSKELKEVKTLDFATVTKSDGNLDQGKNKVIQQGQPGEKVITTRVVYENGKEVSKKVISEVVTKKPVEKIIAMGTSGNYTPSRGTNMRYSNVMRMKATAYTSDYESTGKSPGHPQFGITATGTTARRNNGGYSTIAVDPRVIPLGTKVYVEGYGYAIAEDTGGAIKGNIIDVYLDNNNQANNWGVKWVNVYILK
ncbi:3D domain-containing protein [uncultured Clostridium sp.]|uniref:3D domain-containing protein n=1 Tax=uncultured Clostridium sp. TaxID=59620 RepID=UPI0028E8A981|nr:3D domain-containing protein [uncultured Clostridium sp.]